VTASGTSRPLADGSFRIIATVGRAAGRVLGPGVALIQKRTLGIWPIHRPQARRRWPHLDVERGDYPLTATAVTSDPRSNASTAPPPRSAGPQRQRGAGNERVRTNAVGVGAKPGVRPLQWASQHVLTGRLQMALPSPVVRADHRKAATRAACSAMTRALSSSGVPAGSPLTLTNGLDQTGSRGQPPQLSL
jgi:hypothetical protein